MIWNLDEFKQRHDPVIVGALALDEPIFLQDHFALGILDMPIRVPGSAYRLPDIIARAWPVVKVCDSHAADRGGDDRFCYLTVDQRLVKAGTTHRYAGCHVDGFQGARIDPKVEADFSYVVADALPTVFYRQAWDVGGLDVAHDNFFRAFDEQARPDAAWRARPGEVVYCDAWCVHRADVAPIDMVRTFVRLSYSVREFDRIGNHVNPLFGRMWQYVSRDAPKGLR